MEQNPFVPRFHQFSSLYILLRNSHVIRNEVFHFAQAKENIYFPSLLICAAQLLSSLSAP
jgi:hypothetical protein